MTFNPQAPPVYKPTSQRVAAPPIYLPQQANNSSAQLKPAANFRTETRPTPPVYRPQQTSGQGVQRNPTANSGLKTQAMAGVYRVPQATPSLQPKASGSFRVETRPAPPVYQSQQNGESGVQPKTSPNVRVETHPVPPVYRPQSVGHHPSGKPTPSQNTRMAAIQPYTMVRAKGFEGKKSENGSYVTGINLSEMYVLPGKTVKRSYRTSEVVTIAKVDYEVWKPSFSVIEDCVASMEEIMHGKKLKYGAPELSEFRDISSKKRKRTFGDSDKRNRELGKETDLGEDADPGLLEGYVIARQGYKRDEERPQFHGAPVVAKDGDDDVTLEATAPESGPSSRCRVAPVYDMYSRGKRRKQSFKFAFKGEYGEDASVSVVKAITPLDPKVLEPPGSKMIVEFV